MDFSPEYVQMCWRAKETQEQWKKEFGDFVWVPFGESDNGEIKTVFDGADDEYTASSHHINPSYMFIERCVWLPRQDQLQEMLDTSVIKRGGTNKELVWVQFEERQDFMGYLFHEGLVEYCETITWEQILLRMFYRLKFNKIWNGSDWVEA